MTKPKVPAEQHTGLPVAMRDGTVSMNPADIILPVVAIRQNSYKKPYMKAFKPGDSLLRPSDALLGHEGEGVPFVPVSIEKAFRVADVSKGEVRTVRYEPPVADKPYEFTELGVPMRRDLCFIAHVLFRNGLDAQVKMFERLQDGKVVDPDDFQLPARIVFSRSSRNAGKVLNTHFEMSKAINQSPSIIMFELKTVEQSNDKGNWYSFDVAKIKTGDKYTPEKLLPICNFWVQTMAANKFNAHESDDDDVEVVAAVVDAQTEERF